MGIVYKTQLIRQVGKNTRLSQKVVSDVLDEAIKEITVSLKRGDTVQLTNFGTFYSRLRMAGKVRDFKTGKRVDVAARSVAAFRVGTRLKQALARTSTSTRGRPKLRKLLSRLTQ